MRERFASLVVMGLAFAGTSSAAWLEGTELAHRLPETTVAYGEVDVGRALDSGLAYLRFVDPERAEEIASRTGDLLDCLKEIFGHYEFQPEIFEGLDETRLFFVLMAKDEPEVKTHTYKSRKWDRENEYRLIKELWAFNQNRIAVRFAYEWHDNEGNWFRSYGNENWEFAPDGLMQRRIASINDLAIDVCDRKFSWPLGRRPDDHPGLSELGL